MPKAIHYWKLGIETQLLRVFLEKKKVVELDCDGGKDVTLLRAKILLMFNFMGILPVLYFWQNLELSKILKHFSK